MLKFGMYALMLEGVFGMSKILISLMGNIVLLCMYVGAMYAVFCGIVSFLYFICGKSHLTPKWAKSSKRKYKNNYANSGSTRDWYYDSHHSTSYSHLPYNDHHYKGNRY